jgi:hypothetical protein
MELFLESALEEPKESLGLFADMGEVFMGCIGFAERCVGSKGGYDMALENIFILFLLFFVCAYYSIKIHNY